MVKIFSRHKGKQTNHSSHATGASELFKHGVPEKIVQERTGHRSLEPLRTYERSSEEQHKAASTILSTKETKLQQQMTSYKEQVVNINPALHPTLDGVGIAALFQS